MDNAVFEKSYAAYYDLLYADKDYNTETSALVSVIKKYEQKKTEKIFEIGCGSAKHALALNQFGYTVFGVDLSINMIDLANKRIVKSKAENITVQQANIVNFNSEEFLLNNEKQDVAIAVFHVMSYLTDNVSLLNTFNNTNNLLAVGGLFIFDCWYGPGVLTDKPTNRTKHMQNNLHEVHRKTNATLLENENKVQVHFDIDVIDKKTNTKSSFKELHCMRYFFTTEIEMLASQTNFKIMAQHNFPSINEKASCNTWYTMYVLQKIQ